MSSWKRWLALELSSQSYIEVNIRLCSFEVRNPRKRSTKQIDVLWNNHKPKVNVNVVVPKYLLYRVHIQRYAPIDRNVSILDAKCGIYIKIGQHKLRHRLFRPFRAKNLAKSRKE